MTTAIVLASLVGVASPAVAAPKTVQIDGVARFATGDCTEDPTDPDPWRPYRMTGSLEGCWYTDTLEGVQATPSGVYRERGTETFIGCLNDGPRQTCGTFATTYQFEAKLQTQPPFATIHGRCQHPIAGGTGGFAGATGRVDFKDDVQTGELIYRGHIKLG